MAYQGTPQPCDEWAPDCRKEGSLTNADLISFIAIPVGLVIICILTILLRRIRGEIRQHGMFVKSGWVVLWQPGHKVDIENPKLPELAASRRVNFDLAGQYTFKGNFKGRHHGIMKGKVKASDQELAAIPPMYDENDPVVKAMMRVTLARAAEMRKKAMADLVAKAERAKRMAANKAAEMSAELRELLNPRGMNLTMSSGQVQSLREEQELEVEKQATAKRGGLFRSSIGSVAPSDHPMSVRSSSSSSVRTVSSKGSIATVRSAGGGGPFGVERLIGKDLRAVVGLRVTLRKPPDGETSEEFEERMLHRGSIVWVDDTDTDGDVKTGDLSAVVWDAHGEREVYRSGLSGQCDLALAVGPDQAQVGPKLLRKAMAPPARKPPKWKGIGGGQRGQIVVKEETPDHDVIFMDRWGQRRGKASQVDGKEEEEGFRRASMIGLENALQAGMLDPRRRASLTLPKIKKNPRAKPEMIAAEDIKPLGELFVRLLYAEGLPVTPKPGGGPRTIYATVDVREKRIVTTESTTNNASPEWIQGQGMGRVWEPKDTIQVIVWEKIKGRKDVQVGSARVYLDDVRGRQTCKKLPRGDRAKEVAKSNHMAAMASVEGKCDECEGTGVNIMKQEEEDESSIAKCKECYGSGTSYERWVKLEMCEGGLGCVRLRAKFILPPEAVKEITWDQVNGEELLPSQYGMVSYHDDAATIEWKRQIQLNKHAILATMQSENKHPLEKLIKVVGRARLLGAYLPGSENQMVEPLTKGMDQSVPGIAKKADMRLQVLADAERRMGPCAASLRMAMSRWGGLSTLAQKKAIVYEMSERFSHLMQTAAELNMHHHRKHSAVVAQAHKMCENVDEVLEIVTQLRLRGIVSRQNQREKTGFTPREEKWQEAGLENMGKARIQGDKAAGKL